jgi:signal transduction histidine kinase
MGGQDVPASEEKRVLILESFGRDFASWSTFMPVFKTDLAQQSGMSILFHEASLGTSRADDAQVEVAFAEYLRALYMGRPPDLVVPVGAEAAQFWWRHRRDLFPATPVVLGGIENRMLRMLPFGSSDTGVAFEIDLPAIIESILQALPATNNFAVVLGVSPLERFWVAQVWQDWEPFTNHGQFVWLNRLPFTVLCRRAAALPPRSVLTYEMLLVDAAGVSHEQLKALDQLCAAANAPVFGVFEEQLGHGIIGGRLISSETLGRETARVAVRVLGGESAGKIAPLVLGGGPPTFDWRELQRWHLSEEQLPPGSLVRFRQPSAWQRYRWYIVGSLGIMLFQAATIVGLLAQRIRRRRAEASAFEVSGRLIMAQEEERRRMARELHDGLGQDLLVVASQAQLSLSQEQNPPGTAARLKDIAETAKQALQQARRMAHNLRPGLLDELGFTKAVQATLQKASQASGISMAICLADVDGLLSPEFEVNLFHIIQESLNNLLKHANASEAKITLTQAHSRLRLVVEDNGCGFEPSRLESGPPDQRGFGLRQIAERAKIMGGRVDIKSRPGQGTRLMVEVPFQNSPRCVQPVP